MNGNEFLPNSNKSKVEQQNKEERKVEKIVRGPVKVKKKSGLRKFADEFVAGDATSIKDHMMKDVLVPNVKKIIWEVLTGGLDIFLNGKDGGSYRSKTNAARVSYRDYYNNDKRPSSSDNSSRNRGGYSCNDLIFGSRGEAEEVLSQMCEMLAEYDNTPVSVGEFYSLVGEPHTPVDHKWGWKDLSSAYVSRGTDGYVIKLPRPVPITD